MTQLLSIGNTRTVCAMLSGDGSIAGVRRVPTRPPDHAILASGSGPLHLLAVVDDVARSFASAARSAGREVTWWGVDREIPVAHPYRPPERPGADRLVAAYAAHRRVRGPCVVVDAGTAVTVDAVGPDGGFLGGAIAPGFGTIWDALREHAPALPPAGPEPPAYPAESTAGAVSLGVHAAFGGLLETLVTRALARLGSAPVLVTGGDAALAAKKLDRLRPVVVPELLLEGLAVLARS